MNIARNEIRTGLLVVFSLAVLVSAILYLGAPGVFTPMNTYWVYAENASGLRTGNDVLLAGRKIGQVVRLYSPVPEAKRPVVNGVQKLRLEALIEVRVARSAVIYKDVRVFISQYGFLGEMLLDFTSGREWSGMAEDGATFIAERTPGLEQAAPILAERLDPVLKKAIETFDSLQKTADNLTKLTAEDGEVKKTLSEFRDFGSNLKDLTAEGGPLRLSLENLKSLTGAESELAKALANIEDLTNEKSSLARTIKNAEEFTAKLSSNKDINISLRNFRRASEGLNSTIGGLNPRLTNIAHNLEQATDTVKRQPWRLIWPTTKKYPEDKKSTPSPRPALRLFAPRATPVRATPPRATPARRVDPEKNFGSRDLRLPKTGR